MQSQDVVVSGRLAHVDSTHVEPPRRLVHSHIESDVHLRDAQHGKREKAMPEVIQNGCIKQFFDEDQPGVPGKVRTEAPLVVAEAELQSLLSHHGAAHSREPDPTNDCYEESTFLDDKINGMKDHWRLSEGSDDDITDSLRGTSPRITESPQNVSNMHLLFNNSFHGPTEDMFLCDDPVLYKDVKVSVSHHSNPKGGMQKVVRFCLFILMLLVLAMVFLIPEGMSIEITTPFILVQGLTLARRGFVEVSMQDDVCKSHCGRNSISVFNSLFSYFDAFARHNDPHRRHSGYIDTHKHVQN